MKIEDYIFLREKRFNRGNWNDGVCWSICRDCTPNNALKMHGIAMKRNEERKKKK